MRYKISTQYLSTKSSPFQILSPCVLCALPAVVVAVLWVRAVLCGVFGRLAPSGVGGFFGKSLGAAIGVPPQIPGFPPSGRPDPAGVGGPARFARRGAGPGPRGAPAADVFGHE